MAQKLMRQPPIATEEINPSYSILPNQTNAVTLMFADPLVLAIANGSMTTEQALFPRGLQIKVLSNSHPSVVQTEQIAYEKLGFGSILLTANA